MLTSRRLLSRSSSFVPIRRSTTTVLASTFLSGQSSVATRVISQLTARPQLRNSSITSSPPTSRFGFKSITTMAGTTKPFNNAVIQAMRKLYPEELADKSWDNTGLLLDQAPSFPQKTDNSKPTALLTNDLTKPVVDEALEKGASVIVCYHPVIFRPLKSLTTKDPMQAQLLRLITAGVTVYCPHTAVDAAVGGLNDWLCDILVDGDKEVKRIVAEPISRPLPESVQGQDVGYGRVFELSQSITLQTLLKRFAAGIGGQKYLMVALPPTPDDLNKTQNITKVGVCAGSGGDVLKNADAQVLVTGEMAHHYALRHSQLGQIVVTCFHSNSERKFLEKRLKPQLEAELRDAGYGDALVVASSADRDPFDIIDVRDLA
ncbi:GTP cyclohydrolase 1 type 2/Nif3 [Astrocystis sublimbata]|nr:GTP cyclohydrolase 1 type 2/Nif3 [Astrocystis sublimbata]